MLFADSSPQDLCPQNPNHVDSTVYVRRADVVLHELAALHVPQPLAADFFTDVHRYPALPPLVSRRAGYQNTRSGFSARLVEFAMKPKILSMQHLLDVGDLPVVQTEMFNDLIHRVQPGDRVALNVKRFEQRIDRDACNSDG